MIKSNKTSHLPEALAYLNVSVLSDCLSFHFCPATFFLLLDSHVTSGLPLWRPFPEAKICKTEQKHHLLEDWEEPYGHLFMGLRKSEDVMWKEKLPPKEFSIPFLSFFQG